MRMIAGLSRKLGGKTEFKSDDSLFYNCQTGEQIIGADYMVQANRQF